MTTAERASDYQGAAPQGTSSRDHAWLRNYNFAVEEATTGAELESAVGDLTKGQAVVFFNQDAADTSSYEKGYYGIGEDGSPSKFLQEELVFAGTIANATGDDLESLVTVEQVRAYVQAQNSQAFANVGVISADAADFTGALPVNGAIEPNKTYFGRVAPGVTVDGELYERGGIFYFSSTSDQLADGSVDALEMHDDVVLQDTVTETGSDGVKSSGIWTFTKGLTDALQTSVDSLGTRMTTAEGDIVNLGNSKLDAATFSAYQTTVAGEQATQDNRLDDVEATNRLHYAVIEDLGSKDATQASQISAIQAKDVAQDGRLDNIEAEQTTQNNTIGTKLTGTQGDFSGDPSTKTGQYADVAATDARIKALMVDQTSEFSFPLNGLASGSVTISAAQLDAVAESVDKKSASIFHTTKGMYLVGMNGTWANGALTIKFGGTYTAIADGVLQLHINGYPKS